MDPRTVSMDHSAWGHRELECVADTASLTPRFYWWVEKRETGKFIADFQRTKKGAADLWKRIYQPHGKKYRLRQSKVRYP